MTNVQFQTADWCILGFYLTAITTICWIATRKARTTESYFLGSRRFGKWTMIAQSFGTGTHAEMPVSLAGAVYSQGLSGIWFQWKNLFVTPFYWWLAPVFRRFRRTTLAEVIATRYGKAMGVGYTIFALFFFTVAMAGMLKGAAKAIAASSGGGLPVNGIVMGIAAIFICTSFFGGLLATAWIDILQGLLILVLSFAVIPHGWALVGGLHGMKDALGAERISLTVPHGIGLWFIAVLTLNGLVGIVAQPHLIAAVGTGKDEQTCRIGQFTGNFIKRVCTVGWATVGLIVATMVARTLMGAEQLTDPEGAFGFACRHLLFPGGVGLLTACFLAASTAACSALMVDSGAMFTHGLYRTHLRPNRSDGHYLWVGRISGLVITLASVGYAVLLVDKVLYAFLFGETMAAYVGVSVMGAIVWRRANRWGALASIAATLAVNFGGYLWQHQRLDYWNPDIFFAALMTGVAALVIVSWLTPPEPEAQLEAFYHDLHTPSDEAASDTATPRAMAESGRQLVLINLFHLRAGAQGVSIWRAYRRDLRGFAACAGLIGALILAVWIATLF